MSNNNLSKIRTSIHLYRDCLRLVQHMSGNSAKGKQLRTIVRNEFKKNMNVEDNTKIEFLKSNAVRALSNYLMLQSSTKDVKFQEKMAAFTTSEIDSIEK
mmetsp:Transcript_34874/g.35520  ORF Transcript_34874/g.35520 Transcript_34874/m.35520 type:complete len:100 (+) Transcript_34874:178-477(+)